MTLREIFETINEMPEGQRDLEACVFEDTEQIAWISSWNEVGFFNGTSDFGQGYVMVLGKKYDLETVTKNADGSITLKERR